MKSSRDIEFCSTIYWKAKRIQSFLRRKLRENIWISLAGIFEPILIVNPFADQLPSHSFLESYN